MDFSDLTKVVFQRIHELDPENAVKIIGYLLLDDHADQQIIRLAFATDNTIRSFIDKAKRKLFPQIQTFSDIDHTTLTTSSTKPININNPVHVVSKLPTKFTPFTPSSSRTPPTLSSSSSAANYDQQYYPQLPIINHQFINNNNFGYVPLPYLDPSSGGSAFHNPPLAYLDPSSSTSGFSFHNHPLAYLDPSSSRGFGFHNQSQFLPMLNQMQSAYNFDGSFFPPKNYVPEFARPDQRYPCSADTSLKFCENFNQGYCKYGANCKFLHVLHMENDYIMVLNPPNINQAVRKEDHVLPRGSFKQLEMEVIEILESKKGVPVPIASLADVYREKYGRELHIKACLKEIHMQGKFSCGLTQLLARMNNRIRFIERHGQYCVILAEHMPEFLQFIYERNEQEAISAISRQVYLTFPPQSSFSQQDVYNYFNNFGPVQEVRIPNLVKRMFGFVTFVHPETVTLVLAKGNPHFIRGADVLVKPYRNKPITDRKAEETVQHSISCSSNPESRPLSTPRQSGNNNNNIWLLKKHLSDQEEQDQEPVGLRGKAILMEPAEVTNSSVHHSFFSYSIDNHSVDDKSFNCFEGGSSKDKSRQIKIRNDEEESYEELKLPESPFACE